MVEPPLPGFQFTLLLIEGYPGFVKPKNSQDPGNLLVGKLFLEDESLAGGKPQAFWLEVVGQACSLPLSIPVAPAQEERPVPKKPQLCRSPDSAHRFCLYRLW